MNLCYELDDASSWDSKPTYLAPDSSLDKCLEYCKEKDKTLTNFKIDIYGTKARVVRYRGSRDDFCHWQMINNDCKRKESCPRSHKWHSIETLIGDRK